MKDGAKILDELEKVDLRDVWPLEDRNFTPWLAEEENLKLLGDTLQLELEAEAQEKYVGPYRADIFCKDSNSGDSVVIENQLEKSDHKHLGQLMTYAAGLKGVSAVIWIAESFTEEHRAALDWLNDKSDETINFFGVEIELWRIGDSNPAPKFNVISKPNNWLKSLRAAGGSSSGVLNYKYWSAFAEYLASKSGEVKPGNPIARAWHSINFGRRGFKLTAEAYINKKEIWVTLLMTGNDSTAHFNLLHQEKDAIENEYGGELKWWLEESNVERSRIMVVKPDVDVASDEDWSNQHEWLADNLEKFQQIFQKRILNLNAEDYQPED